MRRIPFFSGLGCITLLPYALSGASFTDAVDAHVASVEDTILFCATIGNAEIPASSPGCAAHIWMSLELNHVCGDEVNYEVSVFPFDGSEEFVIGPETAPVDTEGNVTISFDTRTDFMPGHPIAENGLPYSEGICSATPLHRLLWRITDGCGNTTERQSAFEIRDCQVPDIACFSLSSVILSGTGDVTLTATDFVTSARDDCTDPGNMLFSFSDEDYVPSLLLDCQTICANGISYILNIWAADAGTDLDCNGEVTWNERNRMSDFSMLKIDDNGMTLPCSCEPGNRGRITTPGPNGIGIRDVQVNLDYMGNVLDTIYTDEQGDYALDLVNLNGYVGITPVKDEAHRNGVSTLDLVALQKYLLELDTLSIYQRIAGDVNNSLSLSALDLVEMRKLILGLYTEFPHAPAWRFLRADYEVPEGNPWGWPWDSIEVDKTPGTIHHDFGSDQLDFIGIKTGDINGTWSGLTEIVTRGRPQGLWVYDQYLSPGQVFSVPVYPDQATMLLGMQGTWEFDGMEFMEMTSGAIDMTPGMIGVFDHVLTMSWINNEMVMGTPAVQIPPTSPLFYLHFKSHVFGMLSEHLRITSSVTTAEAYSSDETVRALFLDFRPDHSDQVVGGISCNPNPASGWTTLSFELADAGEVHIELLDLHGHVITTMDGYGLSGQNTITLELGPPVRQGIYLVYLHARHGAEVGRLLVAR